MVGSRAGTRTGLSGASAGELGVEYVEAVEGQSEGILIISGRAMSMSGRSWMGRWGGSRKTGWSGRGGHGVDWVGGTGLASACFCLWARTQKKRWKEDEEEEEV